MGDVMVKSLDAAAFRDDVAPETNDKVFEFMPTPIDRKAEKPVSLNGRDWSAALDLIAEASEAVRLSEERTREALQYNQKITVFYKEQVKAAENKAVNAERRAEAAEARALEAEEWLARLHDAIVSGFKGVADR